jgi:hypothetical protein
MPIVDRSRSALATVVGWILVVVIAWFALRFLLGTVFWLLRGVLFVAVILGLLWLYLTLKSPPDQRRRS